MNKYNDNDEWRDNCDLMIKEGKSVIDCVSSDFFNCCGCGNSVDNFCGLKEWFNWYEKWLR